MINATVINTPFNNSMTKVIETRHELLTKLTESLAYDTECEIRGIDADKDLIKFFRTATAYAAHQCGGAEELMEALKVASVSQHEELDELNKQINEVIEKLKERNVRYVKSITDFTLKTGLLTRIRNIRK